MKNHFLIIAAAIMGMALVSCNINVEGETFGGKTIKGDGNVVTRNFDVTAFNEISAALPATVTFTVSDNYSCTVTVDENLFDYLEIKVDEGDLLLSKLKEHKNVNLRATKFVIDITAPNVENINLAGSGTFNVLSPLNNEKMEVNVAGSGDVFFKQPVAANEISLNVAGSGTLDCVELTAETLEANVAGSGELIVQQGAVKKAEANVAGSGDINLACDIDYLNAEIAGSGDIVAHVNGTLEYGIFGSGDIRYYGDAELKGDKVGGQVKRIDAPKR